MLAAFLGGLAAQAFLVPIQTTPATPTPLAPYHYNLSAVRAPAVDLQRTLEQIAAVPNGDVGLAVIDLSTGRTISVHGERAFPMASTVKVAIAATYLAEVEAGRRTLSDMIPVDDRLRLRADGIAFFTPHPGVTLSAANLIELMLTRSDNTATDVLLANLGGPRTVQGWLRNNGIEGLRVDRTIAELLLDRRGVRRAPGKNAAETLRQWEPVTPGSVSSEDLVVERPSVDQDRDPRDTATPLGFATFLRRLHDGNLLKPDSRDFLFAVMSRCITGANRIKGLLPPATPVEHKTGTLSSITDDVGFISLPDGRRLIVAAFARGGANRSAVIARAARAAYDAFTATP